jgi:hypothetical protein
MRLDQWHLQNGLGNVGEHRSRLFNAIETAGTGFSASAAEHAWPPHLPPYPLPLPQKARKGVGRLPLTPFQAPTRGAEEGTQRGQRESMLSIPSRNSCAGTVRAQ